MDKIKAIIFDLGGVVVFYDHMIAARKMSKIINVPAKKIYKILSENNAFSQAYELGASKKTYWSVLGKQFSDKKIPYGQFDKLWYSIFWPNKKLMSLIKELKKNYKIAAISNIGSLHERYLFNKYPLNSLFSIKVFSYKVKLRKPDAKIYRIAMKRLNVRPSETVFIDDTPRNVRGAQKIGIHGILFKNNNQMIKSLKNLGIKF